MRSIQLTIIDQVIVSASNFLVIVLVARELGLADFGYVGLAYLTILFLNSQHRALITQPLNVMFFGKPENERTQYISSLFWMHGLWFAFAIVLILSISYFFFSDVYLVLGAIVFLISSQLQEFVRRYWYSSDEIHKSVVNDGVCYIGRLLIVSLFCWFDEFTLENVFFVFSITTTIGFCISFRQGFRLGFVPFNAIKNAFVAHWAYGKWLLLVTLSIMGATQLYPFVLKVHGAEVVGAFIAIRHILNAVSFGVQAVNSYLPGQLSRLLEQANNVAIKQLMNRLLIFLFFSGLMFFVVISVYAKEVLMFFYGIDDETLILPFIILAIGSVFTLLSSVPNSYLLTKEKTKNIFKIYFIGMVASLTLGAFLAAQFGLVGGAICVAFVLMYVFFAQLMLAKRKFGESSS